MRFSRKLIVLSLPFGAKGFVGMGKFADFVVPITDKGER